MELARYHEIGRFSEDHTPNLEFAVFHLRKAADCNIPVALYTLAHAHLQLPHDEFKEISVEVCDSVYIYIHVYIIINLASLSCNFSIGIPIYMYFYRCIVCP